MIAETGDHQAQRKSSSDDDFAVNTSTDSEDWVKVERKGRKNPRAEAEGHEEDYAKEGSNKRKKEGTEHYQGNAYENS